MTFMNNWNFGGEIVHTTDFGFGKGGNIKVSGISPKGNPVETSVFMSEKLFSSVLERKEMSKDKFPKVNIVGHFEWYIHETSGLNIKKTVRCIADELEWI